MKSDSNSINVAREEYDNLLKSNAKIKTFLGLLLGYIESLNDNTTKRQPKS